MEKEIRKQVDAAIAKAKVRVSVNMFYICMSVVYSD